MDENRAVPDSAAGLLPSLWAKGGERLGRFLGRPSREDTLQLPLHLRGATQMLRFPTKMTISMYKYIVSHDKVLCFI